MLVCAVSGHRILEKNFSEQRLKERLQTLVRQGVTTFLCGMALGFDLACGEVIAAMKKELPLRLVACVPCADQSERYPLREKKRYEALLAVCDECVVLHERYEPGCMFERNRYMVDRSDMLFAYLLGGCKKGGTYYTVNYAEKTGKPIFYL